MRKCKGTTFSLSASATAVPPSPSPQQKLGNPQGLGKDWKFIVKSLRIGYGREERKAGTSRSLSRVTERHHYQLLFPIWNPTHLGEGTATAATSLETSKKTQDSISFF